MKTNRIHLITLALVLSASTLALSAGEKGAETLVRLTKGEKHRPTAVAPARTSPKHLCSQCTDTLVKRQQRPHKGSQPETITYLRHECVGCNTRVVREGQGKLSHDRIDHTCSLAQVKPASCCAAK